MKRLVVAALALIVILSALTLKYYPPASGWLLVAMGNSPACGSSAYFGILRRHHYTAAEADNTRRSRVIRTEAGLKLTETLYGQYWEPEAKDSAAVAQVAEIESKYNYGGHPIRKGDVVIDCGANIGTWSTLALREGAKLVVAVEPDPVHVECLRRNLKAEIAAGRAIIVPKGVWSHSGQLVLRQSEETSAKNSFVVEANTKPGLTLPVTTVDAIVQQLGLERVDFIKMDIEGSEPKALAGAASTLARWHPRMELEVSDANQAELLAAARRGWSGYQSDCLVCIANGRLKQIVPSLLSLSPGNLQ